MFISKDERTKALATTLIVAAFISNSYHNIKFICGLIISLTFQQHANGQIQLDVSPLMETSYALPGYCNQFIDGKGKKQWLE